MYSSITTPYSHFVLNGILLCEARWLPPPKQYLSFTPETTYLGAADLGILVLHAGAGNPTMNAAIAAPTMPSPQPCRCQPHCDVKKQPKKFSNSKNSIILILILILIIIIITKLGDLRCRASALHTADMAGGAIVAVRRTATDIISDGRSGRHHICTKVGDWEIYPLKKPEQSFSG